MGDYIIYNYGDDVIVAETELPQRGCVMVSWATLWEILQEAQHLKLRISINEIGECLLDWT